MPTQESLVHRVHTYVFLYLDPDACCFGDILELLPSEVRDVVESSVLEEVRYSFCNRTEEYTQLSEVVIRCSFFW